jgi:uncharacterized protein YoxC
MNFSEQPPSKQWAALKYRGEKFAEVWFKPDGEPFSLTFRIPRESFQIPALSSLLTTENLLKAVAIPPEEVDSWRHGDESRSGANGADPELGQPLPPPDDDHLHIHVSLKSPQVAGEATVDPDSPEAKWNDLKGRWRAILGVEGSIDNLRLTVEGIQTEMVSAAKQTLMTEEKVNALNPDVAHWNKAKNRVHFVLPKVKEFIHRATWATGAPERKKLDAHFKNDEQPDISIAEMDKLLEQLENLLKDRQVLSSHGMTVYQECKNISTDIQTALRTLKANAARNADRKRRAAKSKGKFFKDVRRITGAD